MRGADPQNGRRFLDRYRGMIFDLDGTLADSMGIWDTLCGDWLAARGLGPPGDLKRRLAPLSVMEAAEYAARTFAPEESPRAIAACWEAMVIDRYRDQVPLKEGAAELLRALKSRGRALALATSCFPAAVRAFLGARSIGDLFSTVLFTGDFPGGKGGPGIWLAAAEGLGLPPEQCLVFEDLEAALPGVRAAGIGGFAAVYDPSCPDWEALRAGADLAVRSLRELVYYGP